MSTMSNGSDLQETTTDAVHPRFLKKPLAKIGGTVFWEYYLSLSFFAYTCFSFFNYLKLGYKLVSGLQVRECKQ